MPVPAPAITTILKATPPPWLTFILGPVLAVGASYVGVQVSLTEAKTSLSGAISRVVAIESRMDRDDTTRRVHEATLSEVRARQAAGQEVDARLNREMELLDARSAARHADGIGQVNTLRADTALQVSALRADTALQIASVRDLLSRFLPYSRRLEGSTAQPLMLPGEAETILTVRSPIP